MSDDARTAHASSALAPPVKSVQAAAKRLLQRAVALLPFSAEYLAEQLDQSEALVEAWAKESAKTNHVPLWILAHPRLPAAVREFLLAGLDVAYAGGRGLRAPDCDAAWRSILVAVSPLIAAFAADLDGTDEADAAARLPDAMRLQAQVNELVAQLQRRAGVVAGGVQ